MDRPKEFMAWAVETFGHVALNYEERHLRFLEEAIEVAHAGYIRRRTIDQIIDRVYSRQRGSISQEIGQAQATLECLAESMGLSADAEAGREFARVKTIPKDEWTKRHLAKVALQIANTE